MAEARWTVQAETDLEEIAFYIAFEQKRPATADQVVDRIREAADLYASQPHMGTDATELGENLQAFPHQRWVVIYEVITDGILVRAVVDGARDYPNWND